MANAIPRFRTLNCLNVIDLGNYLFKITKNCVFDNNRGDRKKRQNFNSRILSMELEVGPAHFVGYKGFISCFWVL